MRGARYKYTKHAWGRTKSVQQVLLIKRKRNHCNMGKDRSSWMIYVYGLVPCAGGLGFGYDTGSMSGILAMPQFLHYMNDPGNFLQGGVTASIQAGAFVGSLSTGAFLADRLGRKRTILVGTAMFVAGVIISASAQNISQLIAGRVINGVGNGCLAMMVPLYQSEIAPSNIRGRIISLQQCFINLGILLAFWIQYATSHIGSSAAWRVPTALMSVPAIFLHIATYFLPESPRWLIQKDREEQAIRVLARLRTSGDASKPEITAEIREIVGKIAWEKLNPAPSYAQMIFGREKRRTWLGIGVQFMQQVTGINVIMYYAVFLFQQAGIHGTRASLLANGIQGVVLNVCVWPNMYWIDTWGRRRPMIIGGVGMGISMMLIGVIMATLGNPSYDALTHKTVFSFANAAGGRVAIAFVYIYVAFFSLTWGCVAWVYPNEMFSMSMRGRGTSLSSATNWFVNFWFALYIPTAMAKITWKLYIIFAALCYAISVTCYLFYPETARKSLEEIDFLFLGDRSVFVYSDRDATKVGAIFERDLTRGEALVFGDDVRKAEVVEVATKAGEGYTRVDREA